ncbi:MAG: hypothetical protein JSU05_05970 [Bacteroidetes bacterium]|nr:hypothetical protein [Bacteroidota bacterium]
MLKQFKHKRFINAMNDMQSSPRCYWYALLHTSIEPVGNDDNDNTLRPGCVHT